MTILPLKDQFRSPVMTMVTGQYDMTHYSGAIAPCNLLKQAICGKLNRTV